MGYVNTLNGYVKFRLNKTDDLQYDASAELKRLVGSYIKHCKTRDPEDLRVEDLEDSIDFSYKVVALVCAFYEAQLDPEETALCINSCLAHGPNPEPVGEHFVFEKMEKSESSESKKPHLELKRTYGLIEMPNNNLKDAPGDE